MIQPSRRDLKAMTGQEENHTSPQPKNRDLAGETNSQIDATHQETAFFPAGAPWHLFLVRVCWHGVAKLVRASAMSLLEAESSVGMPRSTG
jgi:hypothetical protein